MLPVFFSYHNHQNYELAFGKLCLALRGSLIRSLETDKFHLNDQVFLKINAKFTEFLHFPLISQGKKKKLRKL